MCLCSSLTHGAGPSIALPRACVLCPEGLSPRLRVRTGCHLTSRGNFTLKQIAPRCQGSYAMPRGTQTGTQCGRTFWNYSSLWTAPWRATSWLLSTLPWALHLQVNDSQGAGLCTCWWHHPIASCSKWPLDLLSLVEAGPEVHFYPVLPHS